MSYDSPNLEERVAALEARTITVADLPVRKLQDRLERDWQPEAGVLLPGAVVMEGKTVKLYGPYDTGETGDLAQYIEEGIAVSHNLALATAECYVLGVLYDGNYAAGFGWRASMDSPNAFTIHMQNLTSAAGVNGRAGWRGFLVHVR